MKKILFVLLLIVQTASAQVNLNQGLMAYYPFNGNANDASGNNLHPVFNNAYLTIDRFGNANSAYHFNGIDNYMRIQNNPKLNFGNKISLVVWVRPLGFYTGPCHGNSILIKGDDANWTIGYYGLRYDDAAYLNSTQCGIPTPDINHENYWGFQAVSQGGYTPYVALNEWICVIYTYDGTNAKLYLNCQLVIDRVAPGFTFTNSYDLFFGKMNSPIYPYWLNADLDEIRIYDRTLNLDEVNALVGTCLTPCPQTNDFTTTADTCNPLQFNFSTTASGFNNIRWDFGDGNTSTGQTSVSHSYSNAGNYLVTLITDYNTCSDTVKKTVTANAQMNFVNISNSDTTICEGSPAQLSATGGVSYSWSPATGLSNPAISNPIASPVVTTQYIVSGTNANGCSANDTVLVNVNPKPVIAISNDSSICKNTSVQLIATGGASYSWSPAGSLNNPSIANPLATPLISTTYYVTVTDALSCSNQDSVKIDIVSADNFTVNPDLQTCLNTPVQLQATGGFLYTWQPSLALNNSTVSNPVASPASTTTYSVIITESKCNESDTLTTTVTVLPLPDVRAGKSNDIDCSQNQAQLTGSGAVSYSWSPGETLNSTTLSNPVATPIVTTLYFVSGADAFGCVNTDSITVNVTGANISNYLMPTAFTPNGDGLNDCFGIRYWGNIEALEFSIYNRWGERVFFTKNPADCWDGSYKGKKQNTGVFIYMIKASTRCTPEVFRKGTFTLIR